MFYNNTYYMSHCVINKSKTSKFPANYLSNIACTTTIQAAEHFSVWSHFLFATQYANKDNSRIISLTAVKSHKLCWYLYTSFPLLKIYERFMNSHQALVSCAFVILTDFSLHCKNFSTPN